MSAKFGRKISKVSLVESLKEDMGMPKRAAVVFIGIVISLLLLAAIPRLLYRPQENGNESTDLLNESRALGELIIGIEYVVEGLGEHLVDLGIPAVKPLPETFSWDKMQKEPGRPIDFTITDNYVREFQGNGFTHLVLGLRVAGLDLFKTPWMIDDRYPNSQAVDPDYQPLYREWVRSIVERYDMDGIDDMPGLKHPVIHYEIGVEFSSYQPEPTELYLDTLELGYHAAHNASDDVIVGHSAFLLTPVFRDDPGPGEYEEAFELYSEGTAGKGLADIRMVLDRPDIFDFVNVHNLGWPYEIERIVRWVDYELALRDYSKPIIISDTVPTSFAGFGPATRCEGEKLAILLPPAAEGDRCRLADYFNRLISGDLEHLAWVFKFLAADIAQRVVIAAEQGIALIDTAFAGDIPGANLAIFQAAAGNSGWSGLVEYRSKLGGGLVVTGRRPAFYSLQQVQEMIGGYTSVERFGNGDLRLYRFEKPGETVIVAWHGYQKLYLPGDGLPSQVYQLDVVGGQVTLETLRTSPDVDRRTVESVDGKLELELTPEPIYIVVKDKP